MSSVDVIVPCYRYGHFLRQCVESVLSQSLPNVRILVIDDASPDNTAEIAAELVRKDCRVTFLRHTTNKGHINTYNEGIDWASGDYMLILSADDYLLPGALRRSADLMDGHPEVGFTFGRGIELNNTGTTPQLSDTVDIARKGGWRIVPGRQFIELSGARNIVSTPTAVVRTELQKQLGGYRPELPHSGDMEMWLRFAAHASIGILDAYQAVYRRHSSNMSTPYTKESWLPDLEQRKTALEWFFQSRGYMSPDRQLRARLLRLLSLDAISCASGAFNEGKMKTSEDLESFAVRICPGVKRSLPWVKLACKRFVGYRAWCAMRPPHTAAAPGS
jgi:glycosyltransferase involved in cell wall biosynthesis